MTLVWPAVDSSSQTTPKPCIKVHTCRSADTLAAPPPSPHHCIQFLVLQCSTSDANGTCTFEGGNFVEWCRISHNNKTLVLVSINVTDTHVHNRISHYVVHNVLHAFVLHAHVSNDTI